MKVLMIDVGGSHIKVMSQVDGEVRKIPSGRDMTAQEMAAKVREITSDWHYDCISLGYPGLVRRGLPALEPHNLGKGWVKFDYEDALGKPVRIINDAAMQALGSYVNGRMIFLGFGTGIGSTFIADDVIIPIDIGRLASSDRDKFMIRLSDAERQKNGIAAWKAAAREAIAMVDALFDPDEIVLGGGNSDSFDPLPSKCRRVENRAAYGGAKLMWDEQHIRLVPEISTWRIERRIPFEPTHPDLVKKIAENQKRLAADAAS